MSNMYEGLSLVELRKIAKEKGLKNVTIMRKQELIDKLSAIEVPEQTEKKETQENSIQQDNNVQKAAVQTRNTYRTDNKVTERKRDRRRR